MCVSYDLNIHYVRPLCQYVINIIFHIFNFIIKYYFLYVPSHLYRHSSFLQENRSAFYIHWKPLM